MKLPSDWQHTLERLRAEAARVAASVRGPNNEALTQLLRPSLGGAPAPLRKVLEPLVAAAAVLTLGALLGVATISFATLVLVAGLAYAIITYVFGVELDLAM